MSAESAKLVYEPLTRTYEIRRLRAYRDVGDTAHRFALENSSVSASERFVYLTFALEESNETDVVQINGGAVVIAHQLSRALRSLAERHVLNVWTEDICVNRDDPKDRDHHIALRPHLLRAADQMICYVEDDRRSAPSPQQLWRSVQVMRDAPSEAEAVEARETLHSFFGQPTWDRIELLQELTMGRGSMLYRGESFDWADVGPALWELQSRRKKAGEPCPELWGVFCINNMWHRRSSTYIPSPSSTRTWETSMLDAVTWSAPLRTKDPRDRLFRLRGICFDAETMLPAPSYQESVERVYTSFAKAVTDGVGPEALCLVAASRPSSGSPAYARRLPSWVPDWDNLPNDLDPAQKEFVEAYTQQKTERQSPPTRHNLERSPQLPTSLPINALVVGKIDGITSPSGPAEGRQTPTASSAWTNATPRDAAPSGNEEQEVVGRLLSALLGDGPRDAYPGPDGRPIGNPRAFQITRQCFRHLCERGSLAAVVGDAAYHARLAAWLEANVTLRIRGQSLGEWSRAAFHLHPSAPDFFYVPEAPQPEHFAVFLEALRVFIDGGCRLWVTDTGAVGSVDGAVPVRPGDKVCWVRGSKSAYLLREAEGGGVHTLVGPVSPGKSYLSTPSTRYANGEELRDGDWGDFERRGYWTEEMELA